MDKPFDLLILGASFSGLELVYQLLRRGMWKRDPGFRIAVVDRVSQLPYIPLIQESVVDAAEPPLEIETEAWLQRVPGVTFVRGEIVAIDLERKLVSLSNGEYLTGTAIVVGLGSTLSMPQAIDPQGRACVLKFGHHLERVRSSLQSIGIDRSLEDPARIVVIGAGISGVELATELGLWAQRRRSEGRFIDVSLLHRGPRILPALCPRAGRLAMSAIEQAGVDLRLHATVRACDALGLRFDVDVDGDREEQFMPASLVLWSGGVKPAPVLATLREYQDAEGWLSADPTLRLISKKTHAPCVGAFGMGDAIRIYEDGAKRPWPTMARAIESLWQAQTLAKSLIRSRYGVKWNFEAQLVRHRLRRDFPHGISAGHASMIAYGIFAIDLGRVGMWFRRFLRTMYCRRYRNMGSRVAIDASETPAALSDVTTTRSRDIHHR